MANICKHLKTKGAFQPLLIGWSHQGDLASLWNPEMHSTSSIDVFVSVRQRFLQGQWWLWMCFLCRCGKNENHETPIEIESVGSYFVYLPSGCNKWQLSDAHCVLPQYLVLGLTVVVFYCQPTLHPFLLELLLCLFVTKEMLFHSHLSSFRWKKK